MTATSVVPLLIFEASGGLMAVPASEVAHLETAAPEDSRPVFDLDECFDGRTSDRAVAGGRERPWLRWARGARTAWLRVNVVIDVVPVALASLTPMPVLLRRQRGTSAFLAAGVSGTDVFLLLDPARLEGA
jgi:hypothetical protein